MTLKEYRRRHRLTQAALAERISAVYPRINVPLISLIERGVVDAPEAIKEWLAAQDVADMPELSQEELDVVEELTRANAQNPVTRARLKEITHDHDRNNRRLIAHLRDRGLWVIGGEANGYYMANSRAELVEWLGRYTAYAETIMTRKARMLWRDK